MPETDFAARLWPYVAVILMAILFVTFAVMWIRAELRARRAGKNCVEMAELHRESVRREADADYQAAVAAGEQTIADADAAAERKVANAGSLADHMRRLDTDADD